jgi:sec-independent protein translocase protein TatB
MSGVGSSEFILLLVIGLVVLGPKRLPEIASQIGGWIGQARRMTRVMRRQLEDELRVEDYKSINPKAAARPSEPATAATTTPNDDDEYSPLHDPASSPKTDDSSSALDDDTAEPDVAANVDAPKEPDVAADIDAPKEPPA